MPKVAIVTGASKGLGQVIVGFLAGQGYHLVITARRAKALHEVARQLEALGSRVAAEPGDIADEAHRRRLVALADSLGGLNLLVNNASDIGPSPMPPLATYPLEALKRVLEVNLVAQLGLIQEALPLLMRSRGLVINVSSDAARGGYPGWGGYGASKAALDLASLTLANELRDNGVAVVSVDPGDMRTEMHQRATPDEDISDLPLPDATLPFWAWLLGQEPMTVSGERYQAQGETWEVAS